MKHKMPLSHPSRLWLALQLIGDTFAKLFLWSAGNLRQIDGRKIIHCLAYLVKKSAVFGLAASALFIMPYLVLAGAGYASVKIFGVPSELNANFRAIKISAANADLWLKISAKSYEFKWHEIMDSQWMKAVENAKKMRSNVAFIDSEIVERLLKQTLVGAVNPRDAMIDAMADSLSAGDGSALAMDKAQAALVLAKRSADPISMFASQFSPVQTCKGFDQVITMLPFAAPPSAPCAAITFARKFIYYFIGICLIFAFFALVVISCLAWSAIFSLLLKKITSCLKAQHGRLIARWENQSMHDEVKTTKPTASRRFRL